MMAVVLAMDTLLLRGGDWYAIFRVSTHGIIAIITGPSW